jgi:uncharacterized membrane protein YgcG
LYPGFILALPLVLRFVAISCRFTGVRGLKKEVVEQAQRSVKFASGGRTAPYLYKERREIGVESSEKRFLQRTGARRLGLNSKFPLFRGLASRIGEGSEAEQRMFSAMVKKSVSVTLSLFVVVFTSGTGYSYQISSPAPSSNDNSPIHAAPQTAEELQALVAPIALYPDSLVAQILTGSTFPDQIAIGDYWIEQNKNLTGSALMKAVDKQSWDPSVKALTQFPSVLNNMAKNLSWTSSLGEAYHNQQAEVMTAVQTLRAEAKAKGNLKSSSQMTVVQQSPQVIVIQPANPQVVYVPEYNPALIYGTPYATPGYTAGDVAAAGIIGFGAGIAIGAMMSGGCCGWGFSSWNCGWHGTAVVYHGGAYYGNSAWHGGYYNGGYHSYGYNNSFNHNVNVNNNNFSRNVNNNFTHNGNNDFNHTNNFSSHSDTNSWAHNDGSKSGAFSGWGGHSDGWSSRMDSSRGWGSMRSSGFGGGRFGGGFGGGHFGGGGFRR